MGYDVHVGGTTALSEQGYDHYLRLGSNALFRFMAMGACAQTFVVGSVTDALLAGKLKPLARAAGLTFDHFSTANRVVTDGMGKVVNVITRGDRPGRRVWNCLRPG